jgi:hypothetical protein
MGIAQRISHAETTLEGAMAQQSGDDVLRKMISGNFCCEGRAAPVVQDGGASRTGHRLHRQGGMQLLDRFAQEDRVRIQLPQKDLQVKILRPLGGNNAFVSYVDAIGELDNELCVLDWKTSTACYPAEPAGLCALDPQMICYSWMTGIERVALVVFVRKRMPEIQYLKAVISEEQRQEYGRLVAESVRQIEAAQFLQHSGIRFPQNPCLSCAFLGLCLDHQEMTDLRLTHQQGVDLDWLDQLCA